MADGEEVEAIHCRKFSGMAMFFIDDSASPRPRPHCERASQPGMEWCSTRNRDKTTAVVHENGVLPGTMKMQLRILRLRLRKTVPRGGDATFIFTAGESAFSFGRLASLLDTAGWRVRRRI